MTEALADAERLRGHAQEAGPGDLAKWSEALGAARHAQGLLNEGEADDALRNRVALALDDLEREQAAAQQRAAELERDREFLDQLETIRGSRSEHWDPKRTDSEYAEAFYGFGVNLDKTDPKEAGRQLAGRSAPVELASFLDDWAVERHKARGGNDDTAWRRLIAAAQATDPEPWRIALRDRMARNDQEGLRRLAGDEKGLEAQPAASLLLLAQSLLLQGDYAQAERVLQRAWRSKPGDFWVNFTLGRAHWTGVAFNEPKEAARFFTAAVSVRPRSPVAHSNLGVALASQGRLEEAIAEWREAVHLKPDYADPHNNLGVILLDQGKYGEAAAQGRTAIRLKPSDADAHNTLANALGTLDDMSDEAVAEWREAIRLRPTYSEAHFNLGLAVRARGDFAAAIRELRMARELAKAKPRSLRVIEQELGITEHHAALAPRLPGVLRGKEKLKDAAERLEFASLCHTLKQFSTAARLFADALQADPKRAEDMQAQNRYNAACAAARAGCGQGKDEPAKACWRRQALDWLKADLTFWTKLVGTGPPPARQSVAKTLEHWKVDRRLGRHSR